MGKFCETKGTISAHVVSIVNPSTLQRKTILVLLWGFPVQLHSPIDWSLMELSWREEASRAGERSPDVQFLPYSSPCANLTIWIASIFGLFSFEILQDLKAIFEVDLCPRVDSWVLERVISLCACQNYIVLILTEKNHEIQKTGQRD